LGHALPHIQKEVDLSVIEKHTRDVQKVVQELLKLSRPKLGVTGVCDAKKEVVDHFSKYYLHQLFKENGGNISEASRASGLERASIQKIVKRLNIDMSVYRKG
jgi:transcriptional regulator of acetoin/glycerol metabolism